MKNAQPASPCGETCNKTAYSTAFRIWYNSPAPVFSSEHKPRVPNGTDEVDEAWERWSLPIGNGYFGANVFGRTETERIQITEKTLVNPHAVKDGEKMYIVGGTNSFSETFIDFGHLTSAVTEYERYLDLGTAILGVRYNYGGVNYTREYFVSYPDKALVIKLSADTDGALSFVLRPTIPYKQSYGGFKGDGVTKSGTVTSSVENGIGKIELAGNMGFYGIDFLGIYKVYTEGGTVTASTAEHTYKDTDATVITDVNGTVAVSGAKSAYIIATFGTDYELSSDIFTSPETDKPTKKTSLSDARIKVEANLKAIENKISAKPIGEAYKLLKNDHLADYKELFDRVSLELEFEKADLHTPTDELLEAYKSGKASSYLEALFFSYGRYLLISSSREGTLPANLQGVWNTYNIPAWACDYTHNINVEMNYWPAFPTNLTETFKAYVAYNEAYLKQARLYADELIERYNPKAYGKDGGNGWVLGDHTTVYKYTGHRSAGNIGFMTQVFWDYYSYTKDPEVLKYVYHLLSDAARYITKCIEPDGNGNYLVQNCDSPEMYVNGVWYYTTGTTYAQTFAYLNNYNALMAAKELGIDLANPELLSSEEYSILGTVISQIDKYDPIIVGLSGQIKEFREEDYYCSVGDEYHHRHIAHLVGLHPGTLINSNTPAWLDAAGVTLTERADDGTGWSVAWKINLWARLKNGKRAYDLLSNLLRKTALTNLWTQHPPFQIDASFGATAGISEMLLQSHEGAIAPLAALPPTWKRGSFSGLLARGGFEVSSEWENGVAKEFVITSKNGGKAKLYYPSAEGACVIDQSGREIAFSSEGKDLISFETEPMKTYTVKGFKQVICPESPKELKFEKCGCGTKISWKASADAAGYSVYIAKGNSPVYTLIATVNKTELVLPADKLADSERATFAVTAVSDFGAESKRALAYRNPRIITEYGVIPAESSDIPLALFVYGENSYRYAGSFYSLSDAMKALENEYNAISACPPVIYVTKNTVLEKPAKAFADKLIIDLAKRSLILNAPLFDIDTANESGFYVKVINGKILTAESSAAEIYSSKTERKEARTCSIDFENVTFGRERYCERTVSLFRMPKGTEGNGLDIKIRLFDCTVDYISNRATEFCVLFDFSDERDAPEVSVAFHGGTVTLESFRTLPLFNGKSDSRMLFAKNKNGERTELKLTDGEPTDLIFKTDSGNSVQVFVKRERVHYTVYTYYKLSD